MSRQFIPEYKRALDEIFFIERAAKANFYGEEGDIEADEVRNYIDQVSLPYLEQALDSEEISDRMEELWKEAREWREERGLENDEGFILDPSEASNTVFYREIQENSKGEFEGIIGIDKKGSPFAQGAAVYFDLPVYFCRPKGVNGELEWLTEMPEEGHYLLIDDIKQLGLTMANVQASLPDKVITTKAVKERLLDGKNKSKTNLVY